MPDATPTFYTSEPHDTGNPYGSDPTTAVKVVLLLEQQKFWLMSLVQAMTSTQQYAKLLAEEPQ